MILDYTNRLAPLEWTPRWLFANGEEGYWPGGYDPAESGKLYQENTGLNPTITFGQPVGLSLSQAYWGGKTLAEELAGQPERIAFASMSPNVAAWTFTGGKWVCDGSQTNTAASVLGSASATAGRLYKVTIDVESVTQSLTIVGNAFSEQLVTGINTPGVKSYILVATGAQFGFRSAHADGTATVRAFSIKEIPGNHALQSTALSRPTLARYPQGGQRNLIRRSDDLERWTLSSVSLEKISNEEGILTSTGTAWTALVCPTTEKFNLPRNQPRWAIAEFKPGSVNFGYILIPLPGDCRVNINILTGETMINAQPGQEVNIFDVQTEFLENGWIRLKVLFIQSTESTVTVAKYAIGLASNLTAHSATSGNTVMIRRPYLGLTEGPYQIVDWSSINDVTENGQAFWHLYNDGGDSLPVTLPADTYGIAYIDHLSDIYYATRNDPSDTLFTERQIDTVIRQGAFTDYEKTKIQQYWKSKYAGKPAPDIMELDFITGRAKVVDYANPQNLFFGDINDLLTYSSPSPKYVLNSSGVLEVGTTLRCDHDADGNPLGILIEGQRTNQFVYSNRYVFPTWLTHRCTVDNDIVIAPDGLTTAADITQAADQGIGPLISQDSTIITEGSTYTVSAFFKSSDYKYAIFGDYQISDTGVSYSYINLETGDVTLNANHTSGGMIYVGGGWYRAWITCTAVQSNPTDGQTAIGMGDKADTTISAENRGGKFSIWGAQFEQGDFPTSYIKTEAVQVTRAADVISLATSAFPYNADEGTLILSASVQDASPQSYLAELRASTNQRVYMRTSGGTARLVVISATEQASVVGGSVVSDQPFTIAGAYKVDDCAVSLSGAAIVKDTQASMPAAASSLFFGSSNGTANFLDGHIKRGIYIPRRLSDAELIARSTL